MEVRHVPVAISADQLAAAWSRRERAEHGSLVIVDHEIAGRMRLGFPWHVASERALSCAVVLRTGLAQEQEALLWVAGLVAAANATGCRLGWPDSLFAPGTGELVDAGSVNVEAHLGPGSITGAVLTARFDLGALALLAAERLQLATRFRDEAVACTEALETDRANLLARYADLSAFTDATVRVSLLPRGETRGVATTVDSAGRFVLRSPTGMLEKLSPVQVLRIRPL